MTCLGPRGGGILLALDKVVTKSPDRMECRLIRGQILTQNRTTALADWLQLGVV